MTEEDALARRVADTLLSKEGTGPTWGLMIEEVRVGYARLSMRVLPSMLNGHQSIHGGMIFSLADTAFAYACNSRNDATVAQSASISFLAPAYVGETLVAEAREGASSGRSGTYYVSVRKQTGEAVAEFLGNSRSSGKPVIDHR